MRDGTYLIFLLSESTVLVVTLRVWFHGPAGEEVTHCIVANVLRHHAKLEEIPGERREERRGKVGEERKGRRERRMETRGRKGEERERERRWSGEGEQERKERGKRKGGRREGKRKGGRREKKGRGRREEKRSGGRGAHLRVFCTSSPATTAMVVGREAAHTPSRFNVFSSIPDATTSGGAH